MLLGLAAGAAGILQGLHWRANPPGAEDAAASARVQRLSEENAELKREIEILRAAAGGDAELAVPSEFLAETEQALGLRFLTPPQIRRMPREELHGLIESTVESRFGPAGIDLREEAYGYLGWLPQGAGLLDELCAAQQADDRVWFDENSGQGRVPVRFDIAEVPDQAALLRLLTRILIHQHFPPPRPYPGDDAEQARLALQQGLALAAEERHYANSARAIGFVQPPADPEIARILASLSPFVRGLATFPATAGRGFVMPLILQGPDAVQAALGHPPPTTRALIRHQADAAAPPLPALPPDLPQGENEADFLTETAGQLGLRLWLEPAAGAEKAAALADRLSADRYLIFLDREEDAALIWDIVLDAAEAAEEMLPHALARLALLAGAPEPPAPGQALAAPGQRTVLLARPAPNRLRFLNTASPETALQWAAAPPGETDATNPEQPDQ